MSRLLNLCLFLVKNENDIVYDCFSGSGTTCNAAQLLNRNYIGSEISEKYYQESLIRLGLTFQAKPVIIK